MDGTYITTGGCHCGNIGFRLESTLPPSGLTPRACGCTFCTKHGARYVSDPEGSLRVDLGEPALVGRYTFGHGTAEFIVCRRCGALPVVVSEIDGAMYAVVNVNTADRPEAFSRPAAASCFDGEASEARLARRKENWIGDVSIA